MASASATLRRGVLSLAAAVGAGTLLAVVRSPAIADPDQESSYDEDGYRPDAYEEVYEGEDAMRLDPYEPSRLQV